MRAILLNGGMIPDRATIFALSSGRLPAAIAVVRLSGPRAGSALEALGVKLPPPRLAKLTRLRDPETQDVLDEALVLWFPGPNSETGEDVAELQLHGGRAVVAGVLQALGRVAGLRPAEAGEFTRRAFENGKLDLTAVEGLSDLIEAETEAQRRLAFRQMKGALGHKAEAWRERLIRALALVEARIDFSDEADVPEDLVSPALELARGLEAEIAAALDDGRRGERLREGFTIAIAGPPNAGKSTLLNRLAQRDVAIVSPQAGTTRDPIDVHLDLGGLPVTVVDTAGIRESDDPIEREGVRRARARASAADLVLWIVDGADGERDGEVPETAPGNSVLVWTVLNKADLINRNESEIYNSEQIITLNKVIESLTEKKTYNIDYQFIISAATGQGVEGLLSAVSRHLGSMAGDSEPILITRQRHRLALEAARSALCRTTGLSGQEDLLAEELRAAANALGRLIGRVDVEDVLDVIFRDFCIGK